MRVHMRRWRDLYINRLLGGIWKSKLEKSVGQRVKRGEAAAMLGYGLRMLVIYFSIIKVLTVLNSYDWSSKYVLIHCVPYWVLLFASIISHTCRVTTGYSNSNTLQFINETNCDSIINRSMFWTNFYCFITEQYGMNWKATIVWLQLFDERAKQALETNTHAREIWSNISHPYG
jgi:hypothetical protein